LKTKSEEGFVTEDRPALLICDIGEENFVTDSPNANYFCDDKSIVTETQNVTFFRRTLYV